MKDKIYKVVSKNGKILKKTSDYGTATKKAEKTDSVVMVDGVPVEQLTMLDGYNASGLPEDVIGD